MRMTTCSTVAMLFLATGVATLWPDNSDGPGMASALAQDLAAQKPVESKNADTAESAFEARLNQRIDVDFVEVQFKDVVAYLQGNTGIQFVLNVKKLDEAGVSVDAPVNKTLKQVRLATALDLILDELELTYIEKDELVLITTPEDAESKLLIRVYDCRDLLALAPPDIEKKAAAAIGVSNVPAGVVPLADSAPTLAPPSGATVPAPQTRQSPPPASRSVLPQVGGAGKSPDGSPAANSDVAGFCAVGWSWSDINQRQPAPQPTEYEKRVASLLKLIANNVDPQSWEDVGGPGSISHYNGLIVVTQTAHTHKKVERVLDMLRYAAGMAGPMTGKVVR